MAEHKLKTWPLYFRAVESGEKPFEARHDDRGFAVGDVLELHEWDPHGSTFTPMPGYTGRSLRRVVTYVLRGGDFGVERGWCILGLATEPPRG